MPTPSTLTSSPPPTSDDQFPIGSTPLGKINALAVDLPHLSVPRGLLGQAPADAPASLGYLRNTLLLSATSADTKDHVWRHIGHTARVPGPQRPDWNLFALGMAYPALRVRARKLAPPPSSFQRVWDVDFNLAVEFLLALHRLNLHTPNVASRLIGAAYDQASGRKGPQRPRLVDIDAVRPEDLHQAIQRAQPETYTGPDDDPRTVLSRLVRRTASPAHQGPTLTEEHAALIAHTYLDGRLLADVAADMGLSPDNASKHRKRAAGIIARLLGHPRLTE